VRDDEGMRRLFRGIGWQTGQQSFETDAAMAIEQRVHKELSSIIGRPIG